MIVTLRQDLERRDVALYLAASIGQVRDVIDRAEEGSALPPMFDSVDEAVAAASAPRPPPPGQP